VTCPANFYQSGSNCASCVPPCKTCSSDSICLTCVANNFLYGSQCVVLCDPGMVVINGNECQFCDNSCKTCSSSNSSYCTSCSSVNNLYLFNGLCSLSCPLTYFKDQTSATCIACQPPCGQCLSLLTCSTCLDPLKFLISGSCVGCQSPCLTCALSITNCTSCDTSSVDPFFHNNRCIQTCPSTFYN
jgi:hypothetical protein